MRSAESMTVRRIAVVLAVAALAAGCAATTETAPSSAQFYPAPPDPPRIQHLATFKSERDLKASQQGGLADFVLGAETPELLKRPYGVAMFEGKIYVADTRAPGLAVFDLATQRFSLISGSGDGRMQQPINVAIDADGTRYVTDGTRNQVLVYDRNDAFVAAFGKSGDFRPVGIAIAGERLYVADIEHHQVHALDKRTGQVLLKFGKPGSADGELYHPTNVAVGPDGDVFVTETSNFRVSRFKPDGRFVRTYGEAGQSPGTFARPKGIALDRAGRLYIGDAAFQNVQIFDTGGRILMAFGQPPDGSQGLNLPAAVTIDYANVAQFAGRADPKFTVEYLILVVSQFGPNQVDVFGFGRRAGVDYPADVPPAPVGKQ